MQNQSATSTGISQNISAILESELEISQKLLDILDAEKIAMTKMDLKSIIALAREKQTRLAKLQQLDKSLQETGQIDSTPSDKVIPLSSLTTFASDKEEALFKKYRDKLIYMREEIISRNIINKRFAEDVQGYLNDAISMITGPAEENPMYGGTKGTNKPSSKRPTLISKEV